MFVKKDDQVILIDDGTLPYWQDLGWSQVADADTVHAPQEDTPTSLDAGSEGTSVAPGDLERGTFNNWSGEAGVTGNQYLTFVPGDEYGLVGTFPYSEDNTRVDSAVEGVWGISCLVGVNSASEAAQVTVTLVTGSDASNQSASVSLAPGQSQSIPVDAPLYYYPDGPHLQVQVTVTPSEATVNAQVSASMQRIV